MGLIGSLLISFVSFFGLPMFLLGMVPVLLLWDKVLKLEKEFERDK